MTNMTKNGIALSELGASCLKMEAKQATEKQCFSVSIRLLHDVQSPVEENYIYMFYTNAKSF
jgi:hypothetical protein